MFTKNESYKKDILKQFYFGGTLSCADISERIGKSLPLATKIIQELVQEQYIVETGYALSSGGRRPLTYSLKPGILYIVSIAMDQFITRIVIMDMQNKYVTEVEGIELDLYKDSKALYALTEKIQNHISLSGIPKDKIAGIGIGMPGFVDAVKGINYSFLKTGGSIVGHIEAATGIPVFIENDSSLIALAELRFGYAVNKSNAMVINIGWGIGLGLILHSRLFKGHNGFAGEFSHIPIFSNNKLCWCGKMGCLETETSLSIIIERAKQGLANGRTSMLRNDLFADDGNTREDVFEFIVKAAEQGDQFAIELFSEAGYNIGRGVAVLIHILNPEIIILSGRGSLAGNIWKAPIQQALNEYCIPRLAANTEIEISTICYEAELIGAAALVMEHYDNMVESVQNKTNIKELSV